MSITTLTLRSRLLAGMGLVVVVLVAVSAVITTTTGDQLIDQVDTRLSRLAPSDPDFGQFPAGQPDDVPAPPDSDNPPPDFRQRVSDVYEGHVDTDGILTTVFLPNIGDAEYTAPDIDVDDLPRNGSSIFTRRGEDNSVTYRIKATRLGDGTVRITGVPLDDVEETIRRLVLYEVLGSFAILAALGTVAWWMLRLGIRPIKEMTETATRIADGQLDERVPESAPGTEPGDLAIALNRMLGHINGALDERAASENRLRRFVADASHELRTPVTTIRGYAELYRHGGLVSSEHLADAMRRTEQEAGRMGRLVEDMLTLAKLDEERPLELRPVDLAAIATDVAADTRAVAPERTISLEIDAESAVVKADDDRVRQVLANVVGNALVHTETGTAIHIAVRNAEHTVDARSVEIVVRDHGAGMPTEVADRATERFFRADPARSRLSGGSGLGLSIVAATVAAHGGRVTIDSAPGEGTVVTMSLPVRGPHQ